jgi:alkane 1-monooxygenase
MGSHIPTVFFIGISFLIIMGDIYLGKDMKREKYAYPFLINLPVYINLFLLMILVAMVVYIFGNQSSLWLVDIFNSYLFIDLIHIKNSITLLDKISFISLTSLLIGIIGTVPGHELTHRKREKIDMFIGNWLLAFSWDCAFALEHVYGHHKNVCLPSDPATAKRGQNLYTFIISAIITEQRDAWKIESEHLQRRGYSPYGIHNKMIIGYLRSLLITICAYLIGGSVGMLFYLLCAFVAKSLLEVINYTEHYGLVREPNKPVCTRHSWNSNNILSSLLLYNVTRHSAHHEKANLKFWELDAYPDAPMMPQGYLSMLYLAIFLPFAYRKIMAKKLMDWDKNYATPAERKIAMMQK